MNAADFMADATAVLVDLPVLKAVREFEAARQACLDGHESDAEPEPLFAVREAKLRSAT